MIPGAAVGDSRFPEPSDVYAKTAARTIYRVRRRNDGAYLSTDGSLELDPARAARLYPKTAAIVLSFWRETHPLDDFELEVC